MLPAKSHSEERQVVFKMGDREFTRNVIGETGYGADEVLLHADDNLIQGLPWDETGYSIAPLFESMNDYNKLVQAIQQLVETVLRDTGVSIPSGFTLQDYHKLVDHDLHQEVAKRVQSGFLLDILPFPAELLEKRISEILDTPVRCQFNKFDDVRQFNLRIVRPLSNDNNPPHRDVWLDHLRDAVNIYIPIAASNEASSLPMVPGSHYWMESEIERTLEGARIAGVSYRVPCVTGAKHPLNFTRPNPAPNEVLVFSPYLVHGGGINFNENATRVSLEARFWRA